MFFRKSLKEWNRRLTLQERRWDRQKELIEREQRIKGEKINLLFNNRKKIPTAKLLVGFLFLNCTFIEIFTAWVTIKTIHMATFYGTPIDFTPLTTLIGAVVGEVIGYAVYAAKSAKENTEGGITYLSALKELEKINEDGTVG